jgi:DNA-binding Lrp family transcriptional regulator
VKFDVSTTDLDILALLQQDSSLTAAQIAERVNLSPSPCWRRINRLEQEGYIDRRVAILNGEKLGLDPHGHGPQTTEDGRVTVEFVECLATCGTGPVVLANDEFHEHVTPDRAESLLKQAGDAK